jgi:predicted nucleotidyltransferase
MQSPVQNKKELIGRILASQEELRTYGIKQLGIFGSFARNEARENSDVDFFINFDIEYKTLKNFVRLSHYLQDITGRKVEIVTPQSLNKFIGKYIIQEVEYVPFAA